MDCAIKNQDGKYESIEFNPSSKVIQTECKGIIEILAKLGDCEFIVYQKLSKGSRLVKLDLPDDSELTLKLQSQYPFSYTISGITPKYIGKQKVEDYLYEIYYGFLDYPYALDYFQTDYDGVVSGGCSALRNGNYFGRNFDWKYDKEVQLIVQTPSTVDGRHAVIGISGIIPGVTSSSIDQDEIEVGTREMFRLVPFFLLDGINDKGLFCTHNLVPLDDPGSPTTEIPAKIEERARINVMMLTRFILDKFSTVQEAIGYLQNYTTIYFTPSSYQTHFLIGDSRGTYVIEFIRGELKIFPGKYITNFPLSGVDFGSNGKIQYPPTFYGMNELGFGLERWDIITENYKNSGTKDEMLELLDKIKYSRCYSSESFWYSELVGLEDDNESVITVDTPPELCTNAKADAIEKYEERSRITGDVWITTHSSLYDLQHKELYIKNQENETIYSYKLK